MPQSPSKDFNKPAVLYHASTNRDIKLFEPRAIGTRSKDEGPQVFAALDKSFASIFMCRLYDDKMASGYMNNVPYALVGDVAEMRKTDVGGAIYALPSDTFSFDPDLGVGYKEWTTKEAVSPIAKEEYGSALEAMISLGVQVYLEDMDTLHRFRTASGIAKFDFIESLQSENQKRNVNYTPFRT